MKEKNVGTLAVIAGVCIFGLNFISMKFLSENMPPFGLVFFRFAIATVFLYLVIGIKSYKNKSYKKISKNDRKAVIITGFLGIAVFYIFQVISLKYLTASLCALLCATIPIFTVIVNVIIYKKKMTIFIAGNFLISLFGVYLVIDKSISELLSSGELIGCLYMILAIFSWIAYTIITFKLQKKYDNICLLGNQCLWGTLLLFIFAVFDFKKMLYVFEHTNVLPAIVGNLIFVGVVSSALGYFFYIYGMEKVGVDISSLYMNLIPVVTAVGSYFILNEDMNRTKILGMIIVLLSIYAVSLKDWYISKREALQSRV